MKKFKAKNVIMILSFSLIVSGCLPNEQKESKKSPIKEETSNKKQEDDKKEDNNNKKTTDKEQGGDKEKDNSNEQTNDKEQESDKEKDNKAVLSWEIPRERVSGDRLYEWEIEAYIIFHTFEENTIKHVIKDGGSTDYTLSNLDAGKHTFSIKTKDVEGLKSPMSDKVSKVFN